ncbi:MAG: class I SAM-dependent rRNA methyltransferase [Chitinophagaceae bacterium]
MATVILKPLKNSRIAQGHPWIFSNEVDSVSGDPAEGSVVKVLSSKKQFIGSGFINQKSQIVVRLLTHDPGREINDAFFLNRIQTAWKYRQKLGYTENCRLVFGEADFLPGLIIDKFNDYFVLQTLSLGMDNWKDSIVKALNRLFTPKGIYERNDVPVRELEGMIQQKKFLSEPFDTNIILKENGLLFKVDLEHGQKTGYFLDQQDNRKELARISKDAEVLEAFCYTGSFSIHAARYGAKKVTGIDISESAVAAARENAALNNLDNICEFQTANAFDALKSWAKEGRQYDVVILDPPAFTKSRENLGKAISGYKEINLRGMKLVRKGGFLVTASCTHLVTPEMFQQVIKDAAQDAKRMIRLVTVQTQAADHPIVPNIDITRYLKFVIVQVL